MTKEEYVEQELDTIWDDSKFILQVLREYFWNKIKDLSDEEFKQYLIENGWDLDNEE
jgi:hypothetical protein